MFSKFNQTDSSTCPTRELLLRHVVQPEGLTHEQCEQVTGHISQCEQCADIYDALCEADENLWDQAVQETGLPKRELEFTHSVEEDLTDLWQRVEEDNGRQRWQWRRKMVVRIGSAIAASVAIIGFVGWSLMSPGKVVDSATQTVLNKPAAVVPPAPQASFADVDLAPMSWTDKPKITQISNLNYAAWRNENREWFSRQYPWVFKAQDVLATKHDIKADYVELLMVSGDIWQFQYDPQHTTEQSLADYAQASMERLASHYGVSSEELTPPEYRQAPKDLRANPDSMALDEKRSSAENLQAWGADILTSAKSPKGVPVDVQISLLRSGTYLGKTRAAAYLWIRENPNVAATLLATQNEPASLLGADRHATMNILLEKLEAQNQAAEQVTWSGQQLLTLPVVSGCTAVPEQFHTRLANALERLMPTVAKLSAVCETIRRGTFCNG